MMVKAFLSAATLAVILIAALGVPVATGWLSAHGAIDREHEMVKSRFSAPAPLAALRFHADWCGHCSVLAPKWAEALSGFEDGVIQADVVDNTFRLPGSRDAQRRRIALMSETALQIFDANAAATGYVVLFERATGREIGRIHPLMSVQQMRHKVEWALEEIGASTDGVRASAADIATPDGADASVRRR